MTALPLPAEPVSFEPRATAGGSGQKPSHRVLTANLRAVESPALILQLPSEAIVATSRSADALLGRSASALRGQPFGDFTEGPSHEPMELVANGLITGYTTDRTLTETGARVRFWVHGLDVVPPIDLALALLLQPAEPGGPSAPGADVARSLPVTGSTDGSFTIDGISDDDDAEVLGHPSVDLVGRSLLSLIDPVDMSRVMVVIEQMSLTTGALALQTKVICRDQSLLSGQLLLVPRKQQEGYIFAVIAAEPGTPSGAAAVVGVLQRLGGHISFEQEGGPGRGDAGVSQSSARAERWRQVPGVSDLSRRELEIVTLVVDGDRVPTIASGLFLTQSTIRNHLSAAYSKLGVNSQQGLIDLLRSGTSADK